MKTDTATKTYHSNYNGSFKKSAKRECGKLRRRIGKAEARNNGELRNGRAR